MTRRSWMYLTLALIAALMLGSCGDGDAPPESLTLLFWQAPSIANPYLSAGNKDTEAASLVLEPLANYDEDGQLVPRLAATIPTLENGGVSGDRMVVTWNLKSDILWSDGTPLTADDFVFTHGYGCALPEGNCENEPIERVEAVDDLTVRITFRTPQPYPYTAFVGAGGVVLQQTQFGSCLGEEARQCERENLYPIGTGPYKISDFRVDPMKTFASRINPTLARSFSRVAGAPSKRLRRCWKRERPTTPGTFRSNPTSCNPLKGQAGACLLPPSPPTWSVLWLILLTPTRLPVRASNLPSGPVRLPTPTRILLT